jgi:hypothetical protein
MACGCRSAGALAKPFGQCRVAIVVRLGADAMRDHGPGGMPVLTSADADVLRTVARETAAAHPLDAWRLAETLFRLWIDSFHVSRWGFASWHSWVQADLGLGRRHADYLRRMHEWCRVEHPLPSELDARLRALDWTKARLLVDRITASNAQELISAAETRTRRQLEDWLQGREQDLARESAGPSRETFRRVTFYLADADDDPATQYKVFWAAVEAVARICGSDKLGHAVALMSGDFLAGAGGRAMSPAMYLRGLERQLGMRLVAFDRELKRTVYGEQTLQRWGTPTR